MPKRLQSNTCSQNTYDLDRTHQPEDPRTSTRLVPASGIDRGDSRRTTWRLPTRNDRIRTLRMLPIETTRRNDRTRKSRTQCSLSSRAISNQPHKSHNSLTDSSQRMYRRSTPRMRRSRRGQMSTCLLRTRHTCCFRCGRRYDIQGSTSYMLSRRSSMCTRRLDSPGTPQIRSCR